MGLYDTVKVPCPSCGEKKDFQSKSGDGFLEVVDLENCPYDILVGVNRHSPHTCKCGEIFKVDLNTRKSVKTEKQTMIMSQISIK